MTRCMIMYHLSKFPITFAGTVLQESNFYRAYVGFTRAGGMCYCQKLVKRNNFTTTVAII